MQCVLQIKMSEFVEDREWEESVMAGPSDRNMKYPISKTGPYSKYPENFIGRWIFVGRKVVDNVAARKVLCEMCFALKDNNENLVYQVSNEKDKLEKYEWNQSQGCLPPKNCI